MHVWAREMGVRRAARPAAAVQAASSPPVAPLSLPPACQTEPLQAKALAFSSVAGTRGVQERSMDTDIVAAEVAPQVRGSAAAGRPLLLARAAVCRSRPSTALKLSCRFPLPQVLANLQVLLSDLFIPLVAAQQPTRQAAGSAKDEFIQVRSSRWGWLLGGNGP